MLKKEQNIKGIPIKKNFRAEKILGFYENKNSERILRGYDPHPLSQKLQSLIKDYEKILTLIEKNLNGPPFK